MKKPGRKAAHGESGSEKAQEPSKKRKKQVALDHARTHAESILESYRGLLDLVARHRGERRTGDGEGGKLEALRRIELELEERMDAFIRLVLAGPGGAPSDTNPAEALKPLPVLVEKKVSVNLTSLEVSPGLSRWALPHEVTRTGFVVTWNLLSLRRRAARDRATQALLLELETCGKRLRSSQRAFLSLELDRERAYPLHPLDLTIPEQQAALGRLALEALRLPAEVNLCRQWLEAFASQQPTPSEVPSLLERYMASHGEWVEVKDVAWFLSCDKSYVTRLCDQNKLESIGTGRRRRISPGSVLRMLKELRSEAFGGRPLLRRTVAEQVETDEEVTRKCEAAERARR